MMVFGYLLLISTDFFRLFISVFSLAQNYHDSNKKIDA